MYVKIPNIVKQLERVQTRDTQDALANYVSVMEELQIEDDCSERYCNSMSDSPSEASIPTCNSHTSIRSSTINNWFEPDLCNYTLPIRIINIPVECAGQKHIIETICEEYPFLADATFSSADIYTVHRNDGNSYINAKIVINYRSDFRKKIFKLQFGTHTSRVYEAYEVVQYGRCCRLGHTSTNCGERIRCKQCNGFHYWKNCIEVHRECINCCEANNRILESDKNLKLLRTDHCASYHGCRTRKRYGMSHQNN